MNVAHQWFQQHVTVSFNTTLVLLSLLLVTQGLTLLDFLPKLVGRPMSFPLKAECFLENKTLIDNLCQIGDDSLSQGGLDLYWDKCHIARYDVIYHATEQLFDVNQTDGTCVYWYPDVVENVAQELPEIKKNYTCWLNMAKEQCYLVFPDQIMARFKAIQITLAVLWFMTGGFFFYIYHLHQNRGITPSFMLK